VVIKFNVPKIFFFLENLGKHYTCVISKEDSQSTNLVNLYNLDFLFTSPIEIMEISCMLST
jgi:hypothetical protein